MRLVSIKEVKPGMILGKTIYRVDDGRILLKAEVELKPYYIKRIQALDYSYLYIRDPDEVIDESKFEPIREETRINATVALKRTVAQLGQGKAVDFSQLKKVVAEMIDQILVQKGIVYNLVDIRSHDNYTFAHSVNVCVLSLLIGSTLGLSRNDLEILAIGAMLHDVGKVFIDINILNKPMSLEPQEYEQVKCHTKDGYELLKKKIDISFLPAHIAFQHHEREDGSGYPRGLNGRSIHRFAKVVAVADAFDAMTSTRVYQNGISTGQAIEKLSTEAVSKYDPKIVKNFIHIIAPYPVGSILLLGNGDQVVVKSVSRYECQVKVMAGLHKDSVFDLYQYPELKVTKRFS